MVKIHLDLKNLVLKCMQETQNMSKHGLCLAHIRYVSNKMLLPSCSFGIAFGKAEQGG